MPPLACQQSGVSGRNSNGPAPTAEENTVSCRNNTQAFDTRKRVSVADNKKATPGKKATATAYMIFTD